MIFLNKKNKSNEIKLALKKHNQSKKNVIVKRFPPHPATIYLQNYKIESSQTIQFLRISPLGEKGKYQETSFLTETKKKDKNDTAFKKQ